MELQQFWQAVKVWTERPNLANRRLSGAVAAKRFSVSRSTFQNLIAFTLELNQDNWPVCLEEELENFTCKDSDDEQLDVILRKLLPKKNITLCYQLEIYDQSKISVIPLSPNLATLNCIPTTAFSLTYENSEIHLHALDDTALPNWLEQKLLPKIVKWAEETDDSPKQPSLQLVSIEKYTELYHELKSKYGKEFVQMWPETTDPHKFVHEDVAIASYLLLLWAEERDRLKLDSKQSFVDLGCGNGLLVHILCSEGHQGLGIDIRARKIWATYPQTTRLKEASIIPNEDLRYPEYDWLIGNHSDELTPWIPAIAARTSFKTSFFVLPCCAHEFYSKFQRIDCSKSQYQDYLGYVENVISRCGFKTERDKLRIPSTKRICYVGRSRTYEFEQYDQICKDIHDFVLSKRPKDGFQPRLAVEPVRNCTRLERTFLDDVVKRVAFALLEKETWITTEQGMQWNRGCHLAISSVAEIISKDWLVRMKNECGGLQTLLRNHRHVFEVVRGSVSLRIPTVTDASDPPKKKQKLVATKKKQCWFHANHPQGCPLNDSDCSYLHQIVNK